MLQKPNVLVLDEPTNHLDLESINALNIALQKFEGTVFLVTHDQDLIEEVGTRVWHFDGGAHRGLQGHLRGVRRIGRLTARARLIVLGMLGAEAQSRTGDTVIFSHVLYQLSYLGTGGPRARRATAESYHARPGVPAGGAGHERARPVHRMAPGKSASRSSLACRSTAASRAARSA